jgi:O-antigen/teichoic acid export membrane protein
MVKITAPRWYYWPLTEEQYLQWHRPNQILLRIKIVGLIFLAITIFYWHIGMIGDAIGTGVGTLAALIYSIYYYNAVKSGKIKYEK